MILRSLLIVANPYTYAPCHVWMSHFHMNAPCHLCMSHGTYECAMSRTHGPNITYVWVMSHIRESCHVYMSHVTCVWATSHIWMSHVTHMNESCHTYEWVMSHTWMSHVTCVRATSQLKESCNAWLPLVSYEWVMSHMNVTHPSGGHTPITMILQPTPLVLKWMSHVTYECIM